MQLLNKIQQELKAPKGQTNNFGKYKYRSCEDILEAVKPLLGKTGTLVLCDEMVQLGDRYYVKAIATLREGEDMCQVFGYAREAEEKKGMDSAQITGAASSYARKYALNGLFCIDDTKDADTQDNRTQKPTAKPKPSPKEELPPNLQEPRPVQDKPSVAKKFKALKKMDDTETACMSEVMLGTTTLQPLDLSMGDWKRQRAIDIFAKFDRWPKDSLDVTACIELIQRMYGKVGK